MLSFSSGKLNNMITTDVDKARRATWCHLSQVCIDNIDVRCEKKSVDNPQAQEVSTLWVWIRSQVHYQRAVQNLPHLGADGSFMNSQMVDMTPDAGAAW